MSKKRSSRREREGTEALYPSCDEPLVFAMRDTTHTFSLGLSTVLECVAAAEKQGAVPPLPQDWWRQAAVRLPGLAVNASGNGQET